MKNIIFPTDFSPYADVAMQYAIHVAKKFNARITAVHAYDLPYSQSVMTSSLMEIMKKTSDENIALVRKRLLEAGVEVDARSMMGNPIRVVKELAAKHKEAMIIMGTKGASGIAEVMLGSNAAAILHGVEVPVLAIPKDVSFREVKKIVLASDFLSKKNENALSRLNILAKSFGAEVLILHVQHTDTETADANRESFHKYLPDAPHSFHIVKANNGNIVDTILAFADDKKADMISVIVRKYGFIEGIFHSSTSSKIANRTHYPLLALHEE